MHNYNVDSKYQYTCRIGNWSEEQELDEYKMKEYLRKKERQNLVSTQQEEKLYTSLNDAALTYSQDGLIRFGDRIMLQSLSAQGFVACDIYDKIVGQNEAYAISVTQNLKPQVRSVFELQRYDKEQDFYQDDIIHYGQQFRIQINKRLFDKDLFISSCHITPQKSAKFSAKQEVCAINQDTISTVWVFEYSDPKLRFEMKGQPVNAHEPVLIKHVITNQWLACNDQIIYDNQYGLEYEIYCHSYLTHNKTQNLIAEKSGRKTIETPMKNQHLFNHFKVFTSFQPESNFDDTFVRQKNAPTSEDLLVKLKRQLRIRGPYGFSSFAHVFYGLDKQNLKVLPNNLFIQAFKIFGLSIQDQDIQQLVLQYQNQNRSINYQVFLNQLRGQLDQNRLDLIEKAYLIIKEKLGKITLFGLIELFKKQKHPDVLKKYNTEKEVLNDFIINWGNIDQYSEINQEVFQNYYHNFSISVDKDDYFEAVMKNVWDLE
ncbi:hypothetical protein IMG5_201940 [Ichthyophthirius multifiliis]|uniref:Uncharacterized protein n=1 Tax=Ichthyophthirius multifiliis TaxID=5932 RepID=G0R611_ICHMU|nr:hypothetical protein IMG5_201940 [Ichthyophthirius multifiliis]EGR27077.1 hypothetical protein IMG5_201940 [Ichthyophthirius multifiliis]|eukprot:XP_004023961.1 hypothetical protein IMG5_201940 [Ichthyophthirius multifiliis]